MDPLTQGVLGAAAVQNLRPGSRGRKLTAMVLAGAAGGMAPDLDVLIRSGTDPLLFLEYHRHFTHALLFIPIGGVLTGLLLYALLGRWSGLALRSVLAFATAGYATHALLDACTTYGTQLFWPFSNQRVAWSVVPVIDPLYTLPLLALLVTHLKTGRKIFARLALCWALGYLALGMSQRDRAEAVGVELAASRGHTPERLDAKPSFGNILLWKLVYEYEGRFYVDAVRVGLRPQVYPGQSAPKLDLARDLPWLDERSQQYRDVARFNWFSNAYLAVSESDALLLTDIRYSVVPNRISGLWGIRLDPEAATAAHVRYESRRDVGPEARGHFWSMLLGKEH